MSETRKRKAWRIREETMTQRERELIPRLLAKFLQDHQGNANAIKCETLAKHFGVPYNTIRRCVFMLTERGHLIA